jgi:hypothetical protein
MTKYVIATPEGGPVGPSFEAANDKEAIKVALGMGEIVVDFVEWTDGTVLAVAAPPYFQEG